jgi:virulence-associated protein VagC
LFGIVGRSILAFMSRPALDSDAPKATAELSEEAGGQVVRLPESFRIPGNAVSIRRVESGILLEPVLSREKTTREQIRAMWTEMDSYGADPLFPDGRDQGMAETRLGFR